MSIHVVTGGTGFIGSGIILELLRQTDVEIVSIVRPAHQMSAEDRLYAALETAGRAYNYDECFLRAMKKRCHALPGDVTAPLCGVPDALSLQVDQFWHCAASLRYENRYQAEIYAANLDGTRNALDLARRLNTRDCFNYMSTAYVAGQRTGFIPEHLMPENRTNNYYEASKVEAETAVARTTNLRTRILRPSVVIGHSQTFAVANSFSGMYGFMRKLLQFKGAMSRVQDGLLSREALQMRVDPDALLNLVPIDTVVEQAVQIACCDTSDKAIFHLTNPVPPTASAFLFLLFQELGIKQPQLVESRERFSWIDKKLDESLVFYSSYLVASKTFSRENTDAAVNVQAERFCLDTPRLLAYFRWYLDVLALRSRHLLATR